ncbi:hypothetical protein JDV02_000251 [Purpureocillium takamizusanense]|uniref:Uncharacterized protein n=1 Tax=Purpureocillium takamizusanense TaxID=2060973 RepID=A0A9Q8Q671_9HYPO|nr:uncharacterized protein JDV02_000251 [Purpureocillium takamizusanense]UNI13512.1 hypothetical protein JDV02_000251 [Purpureocillium takamizusanense]
MAVLKALDTARARPIADVDAEQETPARNDEELKRQTSRPPSTASDVFSAAGVADATLDDPSVPCLTLRMWTIGLAFCLVGSGVNTLYTFRFPSVSLSQSAIQFLAYPLGKAWEYAVPDWGVTLAGRRYGLNPGPFNHKENILIYMLANLSFLTRLSADVLTEQRVFYGYEAGWGFELLMTLATILFGFALAGLSRSLVVEPPELLWPGVLGNTALNSALHGPGPPSQQTSSSSSSFSSSSSERARKSSSARYRFFLWTFAAGFCWYWVPDLLFPALGYFTWICWIAPRNAIVNQVFGMKSGMGLLPLTLDWSQIAYIGSPLVVPTWAILNVLASLVFWIYIVTPALYYSNTWLSGYLPLQSNAIFDRTAKVYNVSRVVNKGDGFTFDPAKYEAYSDIRLPVTYALNKFGLAFATTASLVSWTLLEKRREIVAVLRSASLRSFFRRNAEAQGDSSKVIPGRTPYADVPLWWYGAAGLLAAFLAAFASEYYPVQLRWYGALLSLVVSAVFFIPIAWVYATTNTKIGIELFCRIIAGYIWQGKVLANIWFFSLGSISGVKGLAFAQDLKLGIYCNVPLPTTHTSSPSS